MPPSPEQTGKWLGTIMPVLERGGPVVALLLLCIGTAMVWYMLGALERSVQRNHLLVDKIIALQDAHRAELVRLAHCPPPP